MEGTHYVCTGECGGVSTEAKTCDAATCSKHGEPLAPCNCADGDHKEVKEKSEDQKTGS